MIPVRLNLRNFMCYTDVHEPLSFEGIQVACLAGQNGHGKSALLDAITWALWGKARARTADELIHQAPGVTEMEVEFEFRLGEAQYRVIRKRSRIGRGRSLLELAIWDEGAGTYHPLTGNNIAETERQIEQLLKMSYETFTNSAFILQGRADSFTTKTPSERKQILAEILDLSYYDRLETRSRQKMNERTEQQAVLRQQIQDDDLELQREPELREQQSRLQTELGTLEERLRLSEARCETLRERLNRLQTAERDLQEQDRRLAEARSRADRQRGLLATAEAALAQAREVLAREAEIERGYAELSKRRAAADALAVAQAEHGRLAYEASCVQRIIAQERGRLEGRLKQLAEQRNGGSADAKRVERYEQNLAAARDQQAELARLETQRAALADRLTKARERFAALKTLHQQLADRLLEARERHKLLQASPTCLVCKTALGPARHRDVLDQHRREEEELAELVGKTEREKQELLAQGTSLKEQVTAMEARLADREDVQERVAQAERALARAQEQARVLQSLESETSQVQAALSANDYAAVERQELVRLERQILTLGYDSSAHESLLRVVRELDQFETLRQELVEARRSLVREERAREEAQHDLTEWEAVAAAAERRRTELLVETADLARVQAESVASEAELKELRVEQVRLSQDLGAVRQHLSTMAFTAQRRDERRAALQQVMLERALYQQLADAFGKRGVQAMLIETAIPELEDEANRLLELMTDGRMHVSIDTQRESRAGEPIETLDIIIRDELGPRAYEMYSGGEAFRVNFAIRIAVSKLLARRAGTKLQMLVIDEGFGSQDEQGRDRLVEAIKVIQGEFEQILIITHLTDLRDLFPVRIEVTKTSAGSIIQVA